MSSGQPIEVGLVIINSHHELEIVGTKYAEPFFPSESNEVKPGQLVVINWAAHDSKVESPISPDAHAATRNDIQNPFVFIQSERYNYPEHELVALTYPRDLQELAETLSVKMQILLSGFWWFTKVSTEELIVAFSTPLPLRPRVDFLDDELAVGRRKLPVCQTSSSYYAVLKDNKWILQSGKEENGVYKPDLHQFSAPQMVQNMIRQINLDYSTLFAAIEHQTKQLASHPIWCLWLELAHAQQKLFIQLEEGFLPNAGSAMNPYSFFKGITKLTYR